MKHVGGDDYYVEVIAFWGTSRELGPNIGTLEFDATERDGELWFMDAYRGEEFKLILGFRGESLVAREEGFNFHAGLNVTFAGEYAKAA